MLLGALTLATSASFIGCKDYDDDISKLETKDTELGSQLSALQTALTASNAEVTAAKAAAAAAKTAADAAKAIGDAAAAQAATAKTTAEEAKAAAAQAKADAIAAAKEEVAKFAATGATKSELNALGSRIDGIQSELNKLTAKVDVSEFIKYQAAIEIQMHALELFKTATGTDITNIKAELKAMKESMPSTGDIESMAKAAAKAVQDAIGSEINTLAGVIANRLTSVTLVPKLYIDGIPTFDFRTAQYQPMKLVGGVLVPTVDAMVSISNGTTKAIYRMNPTNVGMDDLGALADFAFLSNIAESRAVDANENSLIKPVKVEIDPMTKMMTVSATKTVTTSFNQTGNKIYTVALKAPIAKKNLLQGESASFVYSEYTRLAETTFLPQIAANPYTDALVVNHYHDSLAVYQSRNTEMIDEKVNYLTGIDLNTLVTGCYLTTGDKHNEITTEELKSYGLEFRFAVPTTPYINNNISTTDQQQFAKVNAAGWLSSKLPDGVTNNEAAVDKEPIVRVMLVDVVNKKLVDQKYIKIQFKKEEQKPIDLGLIATYERPLGCETLEMNFTWAQITNLVYGKMKNGAGMSKEDFHTIYKIATYSGTTGAVTMDFDVISAGSVPLNWFMSVDAVGTIAPALTKDYTADIKFSDPNGLYGDVTFKFKLTVKATLPTINGYFQQYWWEGVVGGTYPVFPIQYQPEMASTETCKYATNLFDGFTFNATPSLLNGMSDCGNWDLQFAKTSQLTGFAPAYIGAEPDRRAIALNGGYELVKGATSAANISWAVGHTAWRDNMAKSAVVSLDKAGAGKEMLTKLKYILAKDVANFKNVKMGIWSTVNQHNNYEIKKYNAVFVTPLAINVSIDDAAFYDGVISGSKISIAEAFKFTDFRGYTVAKTTPLLPKDKEKYAAELYKYYEVQSPTWDTANAKIGMKMSNGSLVVDDALTAANAVSLSVAYTNASITMDGNNNLVFKNNQGSDVQVSCNVFIKATVAYGWGVEEEWVKIRLNPAQ